jgi:ParB family chromosome partitioning protein
MQLTIIPLSTLMPARGNPRKAIDTSQIGVLAKSIQQDGVLQNLVVRAEGRGIYRVVFGKRRYMALQLLKKEGSIDESYPVPVEIREELSDADALRLATVENVQREQLNPIDEADAFAKLLQSGGTFEIIAEKTGLSVQTIKRRVALATLCSDAKKALTHGLISRGVAEALTLGSHSQQQAIIDSFNTEDPPDAEAIRELMVERKLTAAMAVFARERYTGTYTTDLFSDDETTYFDDVDQFLALQRAAVEELAEQHRQKAAWVETLNLYTVPWWQYRQAVEGEPQGVVINLHPSGLVEVREGLFKLEVLADVANTVRETPLPSRSRERPAFHPEFARYVAKHKSMVVQASLLRNHRKAREVAALVLLRGFSQEGPARLSPHSCLSLIADASSSLACYAVEEAAGCLADGLGCRAMDTREPQDALSRLLSIGDAHDIYEAVGNLTDAELDRLIILLPILCFGQQNLDVLDTEESLFNRIAVAIGVNMREWWTPDKAFLSALRHDQLLMVALECGAMSHIHGLTSRSKAEIVEELVHYFALASDPATAGDIKYRRACEWLPGPVRFPASGSLSDP